MFSSDFSHVEFVDVPDALRVPKDRLILFPYRPEQSRPDHRVEGEPRQRPTVPAFQFRYLSATPPSTCTGPAGRPGTIDAKTIIPVLDGSTPSTCLCTASLPPGWTEHLVRYPRHRFTCTTLTKPVLETGPSGQIYFFNTSTRESTYVRPLPVFLATAPQKEKPKSKTLIPGTDWFRVTTNQGNVFYTNKAKKESVWTIPDEIKEAVELLNKQEDDDKIGEGKQAQEETRRDVDAEQEREIERVRMELQEVVKRKAEDISQSDEIVISEEATRRRSQVGDKVEEADDTDDSEESEEEDWQREAAAQLAKEAEEEERRQREEEEKAKAEEARRAKETAPQITMPDRVDLSIEEGKALFKVRLRCNVSLVLFKLSRVACTDLTPGERHKSFTSLGYVSSALHL